MQPNPFVSIVHNTLAQSLILERLKESPAIILERPAFGGSVRWYYCMDEVILPTIELFLKPGSWLCFIFDNRIITCVDTLETKNDVEKYIAQHGETFVGVLQDEVCIDMTIIHNAFELERDFEYDFSSSRKLFYGVFPAMVNDGKNAITVTIPDLDGTVRDHPY